jgi:putative transposase
LQRRRFRCCPKQEEGNKIATNILLRKFNPTAPNLYWCGDITYIRTTEGWRYLAVWMDLYSRRIIGWKIGSNMEAELVTKALNRALILRRINPSKLVIHTDQGSQYTGSKYQKLS